jgi:hypothetical protein
MIQQSIVPVGIMGPRIQEDEDRETNRVLIENIISVLNRKYTEQGYYIVTFGCDEGFGRDVFWYCLNNKKKLLQLDTSMVNPFSTKEHKVSFCNQSDFLKILKARYAAVMELCIEFHLKSYYKGSLIDDLINRVKASDKPFHLYDFQNNLIEHRGDMVGIKEE